VNLIVRRGSKVNTLAHDDRLEGVIKSDPVLQKMPFDGASFRFGPRSPRRSGWPVGPLKVERTADFLRC
jgi:hypothetical protein